MPRRKKTETKPETKEEVSWAKVSPSPIMELEKETSLEDVIDFRRSDYSEDITIKSANIDYLLKVLRMRAVDALNPALAFGVKRLDDMLHGRRLRSTHRRFRGRRGRGRGGQRRYDRRDYRRERYQEEDESVPVDVSNSESGSDSD